MRSKEHKRKPKLHEKLMGEILSNQMVILPMLAYLYERESDVAREKISNTSPRGRILKRYHNRMKHTSEVMQAMYGELRK